MKVENIGEIEVVDMENRMANHPDEVDCEKKVSYYRR